MSVADLTAAIRTVPDFPKPGINFIDVTPLLNDAARFKETIRLLCEPCRDRRPAYIAGVESRGFIFAAAMALELGCGFIPIRKKGKLPFHTLSESYALEYGNAEIEIHTDALRPGESVIIVDDVLATGGTAAAAVRLMKKLNAEITGIHFLLELSFLNGRSALGGYPVNSLITL